MNGYIADNGKSIEYFNGLEAAEQFGTAAPCVLPEGVETLDRVELIMLWDEDGAQYLFTNPTVAYNHSREHKCCLTDALGKEVYCSRWDH